MAQKTGDEYFSVDGISAGFFLNDFWRWSSSDLLNNTMRGVLAEFIVAKALGIDTKRCLSRGRPENIAKKGPLYRGPFSRFILLSPGSAVHQHTPPYKKTRGEGKVHNEIGRRPRKYSLFSHEGWILGRYEAESPTISSSETISSFRNHVFAGINRSYDLSIYLFFCYN